MNRYLRMFYIQLKYSIVASLTYRGDFIMWFFVDLAWGVLAIIFFTALYGKVRLLGGWNYYQILMLLGWYRYFSAVFWGYFWPNLFPIPRMINKGELDLWLTKPIDSQFFLSTRRISVNQISSLMMGTALLIYSFQHLNLTFNYWSLVIIIPLLISGMILTYALWFISITVAFYFGRLENIVNLFPPIFETAQFPKTAYPIVLQAIITFIIPVGIIVYTPTQLILGQAQPWAWTLPIILATMFLYLSHSFWNFAIRSYTSASS